MEHAGDYSRAFYHGKVVPLYRYNGYEEGREHYDHYLSSNRRKRGSAFHAQDTSRRWYGAASDELAKADAPAQFCRLRNRIPGTRLRSVLAGEESYRFSRPADGPVGPFHREHPSAV